MSSRKIIYLDYNVFAYYFDGETPDLCDYVNSLKSTYDFCYSPAHLEDVGSSLMWCGDIDDEEIKKVSQKAIDKVVSISKITNDMEIVPGKGNNPAEFVTEFPAECLHRVLAGAHLNYELDPKERKMLDDYKAQDLEGKISNVMANLPVDFLSRPEYEAPFIRKLDSSPQLMRKCAEAKVSDYSWESISVSHEVMEHVFEVLFNHLEEIRYKPDHVRKSRSRMHDVSHAIYAAHTDFFVTNDGGLASKIRVAYSYLSVPTQVIDYEDFIRCPELSNHSAPNAD